MSNRNRKLSKQQKFDLDLIYKPIFESEYTVYKKLGDLSYVETLDKMTTYLYVFEKVGKNKEFIYNFLNEYADVIDWKIVFKNVTLINKFGLDDFLNEFKDWIINKKEVWYNLTKDFCKYYILSFNEDFIRKYKDYLSWDILSTEYSFSLEFLLEMGAYVNKEYYFVFNSESGTLLNDYYAKHFENNFEKVINDLIEMREK